MSDTELARVVRSPTTSGTRSVVTLHPAVASAYERLVVAVAPTIEDRLSDHVIANRVSATSVAPAKLELRPWRLERRRYARLVRVLARHSEVLVVSDVRRCYATIAPATVARALRRVGTTDRDAEAIAAFLRRLERVGVRGLPVGPPPSAVLANAVLSILDGALDDVGFPFLRWVDDIVVGVRAVDARRAIATIDAGLRSAGLERHAGKTRIVDGAGVGGLELSPTTVVEEGPGRLG